MRVLAIESANQTLSVAVCENDYIVAELTSHTKSTHGERLMPAIAEVLEMTPFELGDMDRIAVSEGPGSYTGLRIGITTAKTLAFAKNLELVGVSSLKVLASNVLEEGVNIIPIFDARRQNVFTGLYEYRNGQHQTLVEDRHEAMESWLDKLDELDGDFVFVGKDAELFSEMITDKLGERARITPPILNIPKASVLATLANESETVDVHKFEPVYLKLAEAEENWLKQNPNLKDENYVEKL